jgi:DeoR/GlpR family transcriptional regulator of sugar metabolism
MTIRRDLDFLQQEGIARRVRGGAVYVDVDGEGFRARQGREATAKRRIAEKLLPLVPSGEAIGLDASTTIYQFANTISDANQLSVVSNGLAIFANLQHRSGIRAYLTGGEWEEQNSSLVGPLAIRTVSEFLLRRSFVSAMCLDANIGTSESTLAEASFKKALSDVSQHLVVAVDSSKLGTRSAVRALELSRIDLLVTELDVSDARLDPYRDSVEIR